VAVIVGELIVRNAGIWFFQSPLQITRKLYGSSLFLESGEIARYIAAHTRSEDTVAVLGSEPQIYFLANRKSSSGYIYVYPLTEPQPQAAAMRREFIGELEAARPACVVLVNNLSSWCSMVMPAEAQQVFGDFDHWWSGYSTNYQLVGTVDMAPRAPSEFHWDGEIAGRTNTTVPNITIYARRQP
jgi:hypothetical protein